MTNGERTCQSVSSRTHRLVAAAQQPVTTLVDPQVIEMFKQELASNVQERRHRAATRMSEIKEDWVKQFAVDYLDHPDPTVSDCAKKAIEQFLKPKTQGFNSRDNNTQQAETYVIRTNLQLVDEVIFIMQRNLFNIAIATIKASVPKLMFVFLLYLSATGLVTTPLEVASNSAALCFFIFLHQIFWRPIIWQGLAPAIMTGFPDKATRLLGRQNRAPGYIKIFFNGIFEALFFSTLFSLAYISYNGHYDLRGLLFFGAIFCLISYAATISIIPFSFLSTDEQSVFSGDSLRLGAYNKAFWFSLKFSAIVATIYIVIISSIITLAQILGLDTWKGLHFLTPQIVMLCFIITADCFVDPFIITYRLLFTRLIKEKQP